MMGGVDKPYTSKDKRYEIIMKFFLKYVLIFYKTIIESYIDCN